MIQERSHSLLVIAVDVTAHILHHALHGGVVDVAQAGVLGEAGTTVGP